MENQLHLHLISATPKLGNKVLVALHGIGQTGDECYYTFAKQVADIYNVYTLDLYFHGKRKLDSFIDSKNFITKQKWQRDLGEALTAYGIDRFDIIGFSMGGKFAIAGMDAFADRIDTAYLVAPDGIVIHPVYSLVTGVPPFIFLFKMVMKSKRFLPTLLKTLGKIGLISKSLLKFTEQMLNTSQKRMVVYNSWIGFRKLKFDIVKWHHKINKNGIMVFLVIGKFDQLIKADQVKKLSELLPSDNYLVLPTGHTNIIAKMGEWIGDNRSLFHLQKSHN